MAILKFKTAVTGHPIIKHGEIVEMEEALAKRHVAAGNAVYADEIETATYKARANALSKQRERIATENRKAEETRKADEAKAAADAEAQAKEQAKAETAKK